MWIISTNREKSCYYYPIDQRMYSIGITIEITEPGYERTLSRC
jgi:hypothetical protein